MSLQPAEETLLDYRIIDHSSHVVGYPPSNLLLYSAAPVSKQTNKQRTRARWTFSAEKNTCPFVLLGLDTPTVVDAIYFELIDVPGHCDAVCIYAGIHSARLVFMGHYRFQDHLYLGHCHQRKTRHAMITLPKDTPYFQRKLADSCELKYIKIVPLLSKPSMFSTSLGPVRVVTRALHPHKHSLEPRVISSHITEISQWLRIIGDKENADRLCNTYGVPKMDSIEESLLAHLVETPSFSDQAMAGCEDLVKTALDLGYLQEDMRQKPVYANVSMCTQQTLLALPKRIFDLFPARSNIWCPTKSKEIPCFKDFDQLRRHVRTSVNMYTSTDRANLLRIKRKPDPICKITRLFGIECIRSTLYLFVLAEQKYHTIITALSPSLPFLPMETPVLITLDLNSHKYELIDLPAEFHHPFIGSKKRAAFSIWSNQPKTALYIEYNHKTSSSSTMMMGCHCIYKYNPTASVSSSTWESVPISRFYYYRWRGGDHVTLEGNSSEKEASVKPELNTGYTTPPAPMSIMNLFESSPAGMISEINGTLQQIESNMYYPVTSTQLASEIMRLRDKDDPDLRAATYRFKRSISSATEFSVCTSSNKLSTSAADDLSHGKDTIISIVVEGVIPRPVVLNNDLIICGGQITNFGNLHEIQGYKLGAVDNNPPCKENLIHVNNPWRCAGLPLGVSYLPYATDVFPIPSLNALLVVYIPYGKITPWSLKIDILIRQQQQKQKQLTDPSFMAYPVYLGGVLLKRRMPASKVHCKLALNPNTLDLHLVYVQNKPNMCKIKHLAIPLVLNVYERSLQSMLLQLRILRLRQIEHDTFLMKCRRQNTEGVIKEMLLFIWTQLRPLAPPCVLVSLIANALYHTMNPQPLSKQERLLTFESLTHRFQPRP